MAAVGDMTASAVAVPSCKVGGLTESLFKRSTAFSVGAVLVRLRGGCSTDLAVAVEELGVFDVCILMSSCSGISPVSSQAENRRVRIHSHVHKAGEISERDSLLLVFVMVSARVSICSMMLRGSLRRRSSWVAC